MTEKEQRYLEVLMEEMNGKCSLVLEGHTALDEKMERFHREAKEDHRLAMDLIKYSHDELKKGIQAVDKHSETRDAALKEEIQGVRTELKKEIQGVREELSTKIEDVGRKVDGHEDRIRFLERKAA